MLCFFDGDVLDVGWWGVFCMIGVWVIWCCSGVGVLDVLDWSGYVECFFLFVGFLFFESWLLMVIVLCWFVGNGLFVVDLLLLFLGWMLISKIWVEDVFLVNFFWRLICFYVVCDLIKWKLCWWKVLVCVSSVVIGFFWCVVGFFGRCGLWFLI